MSGQLVTLDGSEQLVYTSDYQYAAGARTIAEGLVSLINGPVAPFVLTGRLRIDSVTGTIVASFTANMTGNPDAIKFAFSSGGGPPNPTAHRIFLTVQASAATGNEVSGNLTITAQGA